ncbi:MAG: hypothetical protein ACI81R_001077 [Bradymonadia bacterium]|jgi:hypothetical protein
MSDTDEQSLESQLEGLRLLYGRHFVGRPRATRDLTLVQALAEHAVGLCADAERLGDEQAPRILHAARLLSDEALAIRSELEQPLSVVCADVTTSAMIVEAQFRRHTRDGSLLTRSALQLIVLHEQMVRVLAATRSLSPSLPHRDADRWVLEVETVVAHLAKAVSTCETLELRTLPLDAAAADLLLTRCDQLLSGSAAVVTAMAAGCGDSRWLHGAADGALRVVDTTTDDETRRHALSAAKRAVAWASAAEARQGMMRTASILADCERLATTLVAEVFASLPCASLSLSPLGSLPGALDALGSLHRTALNGLDPDSVYCTLPWLNEVRDALLVGERWLSQRAALTH